LVHADRAVHTVVHDEHDSCRVVLYCCSEFLRRPLFGSAIVAITMPVSAQTEPLWQ
jgi:hypothetical protein